MGNSGDKSGKQEKDSSGNKAKKGRDKSGKATDGRYGSTDGGSMSMTKSGKAESKSSKAESKSGKTNAKSGKANHDDDGNSMSLSSKSSKANTKSGKAKSGKGGKALLSLMWVNVVSLILFHLVWFGTYPPYLDPLSIPPFRPTFAPTLDTPEPSVSPTPDPGVPVANVATNGTATSVGCDIDPEAPPQLAIDGTTAQFSCGSFGGGTFDIGGGTLSVKKMKKKGIHPHRGLQDTNKGFEVQTEKPSIVTKLRVYANVDCISCDPISYEIIGIRPDATSNLRRMTETVIAGGSLPWSDEFVPRNPPNVKVQSTFESGDEDLSYTEVEFENDQPFSDYVILFGAVREPSTPLIVGEVELVGVVYNPTQAPTMGPTKQPTVKPTKSPTRNPTLQPSGEPTKKPTTEQPTKEPTKNPTGE